MAVYLGTANALETHNANDSDTDYVKVGCERVEELPDGGKIYIYDIDGAESRFPVPPEGFSPLTATDEQLMTYGFPPRPSEENTEDYEDWVELMKNYKSTPVPEIELSEVMIDNNNNFSSREAPNLNPTTSGHSSMAIGKYYYNQLQMDFVQPTVFPTTKNSSAEFWLGFGHPTYPFENIVAGTKKVNSGDLYAFLRVVGQNPLKPEEIKLDGFSVKPKDKIHIYISFQRANNLLNIYLANNTTGESVPYLLNYSAAEYFNGEFVTWGVDRPKGYDLCGFYQVTFQNCKAMTNISDSWTDLGKLPGSVYEWNIEDNNHQNTICEVGNIVNDNTFTCTWKATS